VFVLPTWGGWGRCTPRRWRCWAGAAQSDLFRVLSARAHAARQQLALNVRRRLERAELNHSVKMIGSPIRLSYPFLIMQIIFASALVSTHFGAP
jgi:hypothetical protein